MTRAGDRRAFTPEGVRAVNRLSRTPGFCEDRSRRRHLWGRVVLDPEIEGGDGYQECLAFAIASRRRCARVRIVAVVKGEPPIGRTAGVRAVGYRDRETGPAEKRP